MEYLKLSALFFPFLFAYLLHENCNELISTLKLKLLSAAVAVDLVVGVVSARDHWLERQAIRDTWMGHATANTSLSHRVIMKFVVGSRACPVAPEDREDEKSCTRWNRPNPEIEQYELVNEGKVQSTSQTVYVRNYAVQRIQFKVLHPVILSKLGIHSSCIKGLLAVRLLDAPSEKEIVSAEFEKTKDQQESGFIYESVQAYMLPKGFEGILVGENLVGSNPELPGSFKALNLTEDALNGFIQIIEPPIPMMEHYTDPRQLAFTRIPVVSFTYTAHEKEELLSNVASMAHRQMEWQRTIDAEDEKLAREQETFGDIVFVDSVDVYSNLPNKVIEFHKWADVNVPFTWLMKTDDDCYVNIEKIFDALIALPREHLWWGRFRHNWAVEHHGKWAELAYPSPVYPSFACGAGSVLSHDLVHWVATNADALHHYQGEDTSLGIWLAAVHPNYVDDPMWQCEGECISDMYAMPELQHNELRHYWKNSRHCGDPCGCS